MFETLLAKLGIDAGKWGLQKALERRKKGVSDTRYRELLSTAICELLTEHPDIDSAEASILAAEATGIQPSPELFRQRLHARRVLNRVKRHTSRKKVAKNKGVKKAAKKKVAKRKVARKKATKRKR